MKLNSRKELYEYLESVDWKSKRDCSWSSVYFLISYDEHTEAIHFMHYEDSWFESPCMLRGFPLDDDKLREYIEEQYIEKSWDEAYKYESVFQKDNYHFEIDNPQCFPFLPEKVEIIKVMSEEECLEWLIKRMQKTVERE